MQYDLQYDGQTLTWRGVGFFRATSGFPGYQMRAKMCLKDRGPLPEGLYTVHLTDKGLAKDDGGGNCNLRDARGLQTIPRGAQAGECEPYWANWGKNRVALTPRRRNATCLRYRSTYATKRVLFT
jgi:hypothetical protein